MDSASPTFTDGCPRMFAPYVGAPASRNACSRRVLAPLQGAATARPDSNANEFQRQLRIDEGCEEDRQEPLAGASEGDHFALSDRTFEFRATPSWAGHTIIGDATLEHFTGRNPLGGDSTGFTAALLSLWFAHVTSLQNGLTFW